MGDLQGFDANTVEPDQGRGLIPKADYDAIITESAKKQTIAGTGSYLSLTFQIVKGEFQNRKLWMNLNLWNPNDQTVQIAKGQMSAICRAVGVMTPNDSSELCNKPLIISVGVRKNKQSGDMENNITGFKSRHAGPQGPVVTPAVPNTPAPGGATAAPWYPAMAV